MMLPELTRLRLELADGVLDLSLNRPEKSNALDDALWQELRVAFEWADSEPAVRAVVLAGEGRHFCAGIDLDVLGDIVKRIADPDEARRREKLRRLILDLQDCLSSIERCRKPVLAAIHGACLGGGVDLVACCDMRYVSADAHFAVREIDLGIVADVGTLQRLPRLIPEGLARELAYTGRTLAADEAVRCGLANAVHPDRETLLAAVRTVARQVAEKSPLAMRGTKEVLNYSRDHSVADGLNQVANWNAAMLLSADLNEALTAGRERRPPRFAD
ncbi:crotonase/enoyl-CoA hydratase family protein [Aromatoleum toluclasticum]|uniref:crotonase/enoyl-CoA hydratase family protein n=1 Tax=Aromatoleum toluclasticum TaxID=92003 RepID=UPI001D18F99D|nr:crotonase/enoyl-CoA hydratase family protein [Aromatoleum toluclasticum]MCC4117364.1 crotonase/enoyl-CoA hydratase family protein [Aromatoleum toluclasticum]